MNALPSHQELAEELKRLRRLGLSRLRHCSRNGLRAAAVAAGFCADSDSDDELEGIEALLGAAVRRLGGGELRDADDCDPLARAAAHSFGLFAYRRGVPAADRRKAAASVYGVSTERFRKSQEHEVFDGLSSAILALARSHRSRATGEGRPGDPGDGWSGALGGGRPGILGDGRSTAPRAHRPSTLHDGRPDIPGDGRPGAFGDRWPSAPSDGRPGTPGGGRPGTLSDDRPGAFGDHWPSAPSDGRPDIPGGGRPGTLSDGRPGAFGDSRPHTPGDGRPHALSDDQPGIPGDSRPGALSNSRPGTPGDGRSHALSDDQPGTPGDSRFHTPGDGRPGSPGDRRPRTPGDGRSHAPGGVRSDPRVPGRTMLVGPGPDGLRPAPGGGRPAPGASRPAPGQVAIRLAHIEQIRDVDILVSSENVYLEMSKTFRSTVSGVLRRAAAERSDGEVVDDVLARELAVWLHTHRRNGLAVRPGTVVPTSAGALSRQGVRRVYHAAVATPVDHGSRYHVDLRTVTEAVRHSFDLARTERKTLALPLTSICFPLLGAGRGGLPAADAAPRLLGAVREELRRDPSWSVLLVTRRSEYLELFRDANSGP